MKDSWAVDFFVGLLVGVLIMFIIVMCARDVTAANAVHKYKEGTLDCQVVGDEFICREAKR